MELTCSVRPPNPVEMQRDGDSIWTTSPYEPQQIKLPGGAREGREWTYGVWTSRIDP